jgi:hypothetical protein
VRELVAVLILFSVLFGILSVALLIVFLIRELALKGVIQAETGLIFARARHANASSQRDRDRLPSRAR